MINLKKTLLILLALTGFEATAQVASNIPPAVPGAQSAIKIPLAFPSEVTVELIKTNAVQVLTFTGTNLTDHAVKILGYGASCGCTTVDSKGQTIPANGKMEYRVKIARTQPAVEYANILDESTNIYQVTFKVKAAPSSTTNSPAANHKPQ